MTLHDLVPRRKVGLGIDIRGGLLCHAVLRRGLGGVRLLDWGAEELPRENGGGEAALREKLKGISSRLAVRPDFVTVGLPRRLITTRSITMPPVGEEELRGILDYEVERHIPFSLEEAQYDFQVLDKNAERATVLLATARKDEVDRYLKLLGDAGIRPTAVGVSIFALLNALLYNEKRSVPTLTAVVDVRNGEAEVGVAANGTLHQTRWIALAPAAPLEAILSDALVELTPSHADGGARARGRVSLTGTGAGQGDVLHHLAERSGLEVEFLQPFQRIAARGVDAQAAQSLGAAVGLALNGLVPLPVRIDLLPKDMAPARADSNVTMTFRLLVLLVALAAAYGVSQAVRERRALADLSAKIEALRVEAAKVEELKGEVGDLVGRIAALQKIERDEVRKLDVWRELVQLLPKGVTLTLFSIEGREARIGGSIAGSASELISTLEQSPVFENVQFTSPVATRGGESQDFQIKAFLEVPREPRP